MLEFDALTEEEIDRIGLLPKGRYPFRVYESIDGFSKSSGHPQISLKVKIIGPDNVQRNVDDYLSTNGQWMLRKLRHFCMAAGLGEHYANKKLTADNCLSAKGIAEIDIQEGKMSPDGRKYPDKNIIVDYVVEDKSSMLSKESSDDFKDDEVPF